MSIADHDPEGPRNRAPLGMKTTNAKTKAFQTPAEAASDHEPEKALKLPTSTRRPKPKISHAETVKLDIHGDDTPLKEREPEYCPPRPKDLPYESEDFPEGCLNYDMLKGPNLMRGWQNYYLNPVDENGVSLKEKEFEAGLTKALQETDDSGRSAVDDEEWTIGDVPETFEYKRKREIETKQKAKANQPMRSPTISNKGPGTITSRNAASILSAVPKAAPVAAKTIKTASKAKTSFLARDKKSMAPPPANPSDMRHTAASAASRSTIGYTKGRSASSVLSMGSIRTGGLPRSVSNLSTASDTTITPETYAQKRDAGSDQWRRLKFLGAFDTDDEDVEPCLRGELPEYMRRDDDEEEFVISLGQA
jgi:hypothetical protein